MEKQRSLPAGWAVILERGFSESFIAKIGKIEALEFWIPALQKWLASDAEFGIITTPMREGQVNVRTAYLASRDDLPQGIRQITEYFANYLGASHGHRAARCPKKRGR